LLAAALSLAVLALWEFVSPKPQKPPAGVAAPATAAASAASPGVPTALPASAEISAAAAAPKTEPMPAPVAGSAEEKPTLENDVARAVFSNQGAVLTSLFLLRHTDDQKKPLDLIRQMPPPAQKPLAITFPGSPALTNRIGAALFAVERQGDRALRFSYADDAVAVTKEIRFQNGYLFDVKVNVVGPPYVLTAGTGLRNPGAEEQASRYIQPATAIAMTGSGLTRARAEKLEKPLEWPVGDKGFAGLEDNYFLEVLLPRQAATAVAFPVPLKDAEGKPAPTVGVGLTGKGEL
jgi:YidC/Oxa1 family membrane protein insertase